MKDRVINIFWLIKEFLDANNICVHIKSQITNKLKHVWDFSIKYLQFDINRKSSLNFLLIKWNNTLKILSALLLETFCYLEPSFLCCHSLKNASLSYGKFYGKIGLNISIGIIYKIWSCGFVIFWKPWCIKFINHSK